MPTSDPKRTPELAWRIACHEAGHAFVAVHFQLPFLYVEVINGESGNMEVGVGPIEAPKSHWTQDKIAAWQLSYAAGAAAERLLFLDCREHGASRDRHLHGVLENRLHQKRTAGWELDIQSVMNILDRKSVEKVARELDIQKKLTDRQVYTLLDTPYPWS